MYVSGVLGRVVAFNSVIEYQKRGLPHAHILLIVAEKYRLFSPSDVDSAIRAEIPSITDSVANINGKQQTECLRSIILKCMIHGPCGSMNPRSACMKNGICDKGFPKLYSNQTYWGERSTYPTYRRRKPEEGGSTAIVGNYLVDNRWVVPFNPYLTLKYNAHINVEACVSPFAAKYLYLYINKVFQKFRK